MERNTLALIAILVYSTYRVSDLYRRKGATDKETAIQAMQQFAKEAVRGHPKAQNILRFSFWNNHQHRFHTSSRLEDELDELDES